MDFTLRVYQDSYRVVFYNFNHITISGITILSKQTKFDPPCEHKGNQKKFGYTFSINGKFLKVAGSHSAPILAFKGDFIDIEIQKFPRFPVLEQDKYVAMNILRNKDYNGNFLPYDYNNGFDELHFDVLNLIT